MRPLRIPLPPRARAGLAFAAALAAPLPALGVQLLLRPYIYAVPFILFFVAVLGATWLGGLAAGLLATVISALLGNFFFLAPQGQLSLDAASLVGTAFFVGVAFLVAVVTAALRAGYQQRAAFAEASRRSARRFQSLVAASAQVIWTTSPEGEMAADSVSWRAFTGQSVEAMRGVGWLDAVHSEDRGRVERAWREAVGARRAYEDEYRLRRADGGYVHTLARAAPVLDDDGAVLEWVGTHTDISVRKHAEELQIEALHARDVFLSVASHELKTPLTAAQLQIQSLQRQLRREEEPDVAVLAGRVDAAVGSVERLGTLVSALLDVSRVATGKLVTEREELDLSALVTSAAGRLAEQARRRGSDLALEVEPGLRLLGDGLRLEQVVTNLVENAIKYGEGRPVQVRLVRQGDRLRLDVTDRGIGIAPEDVARIFERFERAASARNYGGLGLGLWITRQIVEASGGAITVASRPGDGATFTVALPAPDDRS